MSLKLIRRAGGETWYMRGKFHGHKVFRSTQTSDHRVAEQVLRQLEIQLATAGSAREQRDEYTFEKASDIYLDHHKRAEPDRNAIKRLVGEIGAQYLSDIRSHVIADAAIKLYPKASAATRNRMVIANAGAILHYAADQDLCPYVKLKRFKETPVAPRDVDATVAKTLINSAEGLQRLLLLMLFRQGWRIGELLDVTWAHVNLDEKTIEHHNKKVGLYDIVPLHDEVVTLLEEIPEDERTGRLFQWRDRWAVYEWLWPLTEKLGVRFTPHMARHSFATWLVNAGATGFDLLATGNWSDLKSVKRYTRLDRERARTVINRLKG